MKFIFPPHPAQSSKITRDDLERHDKSKQWVAQFKFGGVNISVATNGKDADCWDRRGKRLATYIMPPEMRTLFMRLSHGHEIVFNGELLHTKAICPKTKKQAVENCIVLFDVLYYDGLLVNKTQEERLQLLQDICKNPVNLEPGKSRGLEVNSLGNSKIWLAESFLTDFTFRFDQFFEYLPSGEDRHPEIEGLILRLLSSKLEIGDKAYDVRWMVRCRKQRPKVYQF